MASRVGPPLFQKCPEKTARVLVLAIAGEKSQPVRRRPRVHRGLLPHQREADVAGWVLEVSGLLVFRSIR
ncbi:hypothetical protein RchiOBHm_Chr2g0087831 [Rosa chinensis]|uniref:Uncharacterized protein n=1 Tax=Rosa chinensis TaxID=74649 RepID=A0A2P6RIQ4_ROSCH|nr:hypothetical protein RchiOBHm_Chr2g0087831 [Rosa chinensis]